MDSIADFEDMLTLLNEQGARYLIVGGLAFIYHAKPRYTKDIDLWVDPAEDNILRVNRALRDFPSPHFLTPGRREEILQIGLAPNRIDLLQRLGDADFEHAWQRRIEDRYGSVPTNWIDLDTLADIKAAIDHPRHQEDARILREVQRLRSGSEG
jgi:hypothetical protein